jgi:hypothetical protein
MLNREVLSLEYACMTVTVSQVVRLSGACSNADIRMRRLSVVAYRYQACMPYIEACN